MEDGWNSCRGALNFKWPKHCAILTGASGGTYVPLRMTTNDDAMAPYERILAILVLYNTARHLNSRFQVQVLIEL